MAIADGLAVDIGAQFRADNTAKIDWNFFNKLSSYHLEF